MRKILTLIAALSLVASLAVGGSIAYLQDTDSSANVMTLGKVDITLVEQERVNNDSSNLDEYTQEKPLYPIVGTPNDADGDGYLDHKQVADKIVTITNNGKSDAYVRTIIAYEGNALSAGSKIHVLDNNNGITVEDILDVMIDGVRYDLRVYTYTDVLTPNATTIPSLKQIYMDSTATNEDVAAFGEAYDTLVLVQGVQADGFTNGAADALNTAFGTVSEKAAEWFGGMAASSWDGLIPTSQPKSLVLELDPVKNQGGTITIKDADALVYMNKLISDFEAKKENYNNYYYHGQWEIELAADIDLLNKPIDSIDISYFGAFDGNGHTISNVNLKDGNPALFKNNVKPISNLTVRNVVVNAPETDVVGAVVNKGSLNNVHVINAKVTGNKYVGGLAGKGSSFVNCSAKNVTVMANAKTVGGLVGYSIGDPGYATVTGNLVDTATVIGKYNVGGLLGQAQNELVEKNTVKNVTLTNTAALPSNADSDEVHTGVIVARNHGADIGNNTTDSVESSKVAENQSDLDTAISDGQSTVVLAPGSYSITGAASGKNVTFVGNENTVFDISGTPNAGNANLTFEGVTMKTASADYTGIQHSGNIVYNNVTFDGSTFLYGEKVVFNNCEFNLTTNYIWTYGAKEVEFNNCTFNTDGKAILVYKEKGAFSQTVNVNNCTFNATKTAQTWDGQNIAAVEIDSSLITGTYTVNFTGNNVVDSHFNGHYRVKKGQDPLNVVVTNNGVAQNVAISTTTGTTL